MQAQVRPLPRFCLARRGLVLCTILFLCSGCLVKRLARPQIAGYVYDAETGQPLSGCSVGETTTDANGYFELPRRCSYELTWVGLEAPPLMLSEYVEMPGYEIVNLLYFAQFGGSSCSGTAPWGIEPIRLSRQVGDFPRELEIQPKP